MIIAIASLLTFISTVSAGCDNFCSGHGTCGVNGVCTCFDNWGLGLTMDSGDCSDQICPFDFAWVDKPDFVGDTHRYAECSARGICNRESGTCECFPGYEGKGCQRSSCPNDCSGHGQCKYIQNIGYENTPFDYVNADATAAGDFLDQDAHTFTYYGWDNMKTRGCVCDPEYGDADCSKRMCPHGTDIMDHRQNLATAQLYQVQQIQITPLDSATSLNGQTFALTFRSKLGETFTTVPIVYDTSSSGFADFMGDVTQSLKSLPNKVIDSGVTVAGSTAADGSVTMNVTFWGDNVQGQQELLVVKDIVCSDGCTPKLTGLEVDPTVQYIFEHQAADFNSYECGRRGKCDYTSGICGCFSGYTGASCNTITALV